ncbi:MAG: hypothetical protein RJA36_1125 [Pseudomonadota bacterium]|jgi:hypothetical protein
MTTKRFHVSDVLTVTTGKLLSHRGMEGVYEILKHLTGEPIFTHQIGRVLQEAAPHVLQQFPPLAGVSADDVSAENYSAWLRAIVAEHGEWLDVAPMPEHAHESIDPISELAEKVHPDRIVTIGT